MKLIILDRDGVINYDSKDYIKSPDEWIPIPGSLEAIAKLKENGWTVVVATNQSGIGRGYYTEAILKAIHQKMAVQLAQYNTQIDAIFYCPHTPDDHCDCRKPNIGLLQQISRHFNCSLKNVPLVGDSLRDLQAGAGMNCQLFLVETGNGLKSKLNLAADPRLKNTIIKADLKSVVEYLTTPKSWQ